MSGVDSDKGAAWVNLMPGSDHKLIVTGRVLTNAGNLLPVLNEAVPQDLNPQILMLNLTIEQQGDFGTQDISYRDAQFEKPARAGEYTQVAISHEGDPVTLIKATEAH
jgi:hypothetical protein